MNGTKIKFPRKRLSKRANAALQKRLNDLHARILGELAGRALPDPAEVIRQGREERDRELFGNFPKIKQD